MSCQTQTAQRVVICARHFRGKKLPGKPAHDVPAGSPLCRVGKCSWERAFKLGELHTVGARPDFHACAAIDASRGPRPQSAWRLRASPD